MTNETIPRGYGLWRVEHPGHASAIFAMRNPGMQLGNYPEPTIRARFANMDLRLHLADETTVPEGMVFVQSETLPVSLISEEAAVDLPPFFIDRFEVTNREFKEFVEAGGYTRAESGRTCRLETTSPAGRRQSRGSSTRPGVPAPRPGRPAPTPTAPATTRSPA